MSPLTDPERSQHPKRGDRQGLGWTRVACNFSLIGGCLSQLGKVRDKRALRRKRNPYLRGWKSGFLQTNRSCSTNVRQSLHLLRCWCIPALIGNRAAVRSRERKPICQNFPGQPLSSELDFLHPSRYAKYDEPADGTAHLNYHPGVAKQHHRQFSLDCAQS